jgi:hypothetical protein
MPTTHDLFLSPTLARFWNPGANATGEQLSAWDRPDHDLSHLGQHFPRRPASPHVASRTVAGPRDRLPIPLWKTCE